MKKRWSRVGSNWVCQKCHNPSQKHLAMGLCNKCYMARRRRKLGNKEHPFWNKYKECRQCRRSPIKALGLCSRCYARYYEKLHLEKIKLQKNLSVQRRRFGVGYEDLLRHTQGKCELCGLTQEQSMERWNQKFSIHHKDGNGRTSDKPNNVIENLMVLCSSCHTAIHNPKGQKIGVQRRTV